MAKRSKLWYLENFNMFKKLSQHEMEAIEPSMKMVALQRSDIIALDTQEESPKIYFLKTGKVRIVSYEDNNTEILKTVLLPGELFGGMPFLKTNTTGEVAVAAEESLVCIMDTSTLEKIASMNMKLSVELLKTVGLKMQKIERRLENLVFRSAADRIREFLKELAENYGRELGKTIMIPVSLSQEDIACLSATSRQTVNTVISDLKRDGIIDYDRKRIIIRDSAAL